MKSIKKITITLVLLIICILLFFLCFNKEKKPDTKKAIFLNDSYSREAYLNLQGWEVTQINADKIILPESFDGIYSTYSIIQQKQSLPLNMYKGKQVERFIYSVDNYNSGQTVYAELLIYENQLIAATLIGYSPNSFLKEIY